MRSRLLLLILVATCLLFSAASATMTNVFGTSDKIIINSTSVISNAPGTPYDIWFYSIVVGILLILISFVKFPHGEEGIISGMAWFPCAFALFASFNIDRITGAGLLQAADLSYVFMEKHTLYHFDLIAYSCLLPLLVLAIINTGRIWINAQKMKQVGTAGNDQS